MGYIFDNHYWLVIYIIVGLSALLVSTNRAMREPQDVERAQTAPRFFFVSGLYFTLHLN